MHNSSIVLSYFWLAQSAKSTKNSGSCIFIFNWSTVLFSFPVTKSLPTTTVILCGEHWKLLFVFVYDCNVIGGNIFTQRKLLFKIELNKYILFHKPAFHRLINSLSENKTVSTWGMLQFLSGSLLCLKHLKQCLTTSSNTSKLSKIQHLTHCIFTSLLGVWKCSETWSFIVDF